MASRPKRDTKKVERLGVDEEIPVSKPKRVTKKKPVAEVAAAEVAAAEVAAAVLEVAADKSPAYSAAAAATAEVAVNQIHNVFHKFTNITPVSVHKIFSHGRHPSELKSTPPAFVFVIGAPGVGKSTMSRKYLAEIGLNYDNFYRVALDDILERVQPFRDTSKHLHNYLLEKRQKPLENANWAMLSDMAVRVTQVDKNDFELGYIEKRVKHKINTGEKLEKDSEKKPPTDIARITMDAVEHGIQQGFNIMYDTTFSLTSGAKGQAKTVNRYDAIKDLIEKSRRNYRIYVLLITASDEEIKQRIYGRHQAMLHEGFLRAINPTLYMINRFIEQNKEAFDVLSARESSRGESVTFREIANPQINHVVEEHKHADEEHKHADEPSVVVNRRANQPSPRKKQTHHRRVRANSASFGRRVHRGPHHTAKRHHSLSPSRLKKYKNVKFATEEKTDV
jgi:adenylate kinase family enzyme